MRLKLKENETIRTITIRLVDKKVKKNITDFVYKYKHFENILLILIKQNYDLSKENKSTNDFTLLSSYSTMRAVLRNTSGGKNKSKYLKKFRTYLIFPNKRLIKIYIV